MRALLLLPLLALCVIACDSDGDSDAEPFLGDDDYVRDPALDVELRSGHGDAISHNIGQNCMQCHQAHGPGRGRFSVAGTLHDDMGQPLPDGTLELRNAPDGGGELVLSVEADGLGNFYTTDLLPLADMPLFPTVYGPGGAGKNFMPFPTLSGACNVCHVGSAVIRVPEV